MNTPIPIDPSPLPSILGVTLGTTATALISYGATIVAATLHIPAPITTTVIGALASLGVFIYHRIIPAAAPK